MKPADIALALLVAIIWGLGFVASRLALDELPPALMTGLRFAIAAVPCLFVRKPNVTWPVLIAISSTLFLGQFLFAILGHRAGRSRGACKRDRAKAGAVHGGICSCRFPRDSHARANAWDRDRRDQAVDDLRHRRFDFSVGAFAMLMISPISFAIGNLLLRRARDVPMFDLFAWLCLIPPLPLFALALAADGPRADWNALWNLSPTGLTSMLFIGAISISIAYWLWGRLLRDYSAAQVVPFALLVPFIGAFASSIVFGERFGPLRLAGMITVVCGIAIMLLSKRSQAVPKIA